ncbi:ATP-binding cassette domain-containing protein (plasmid) [Weissella confusa]|uniref:ATP-binding cassette domain-containing protein n=1 Tax=Weissella confusa TaxID=1583 RepID=UPI002407D4C2|nr:ATP-binding cassette domain-containing protein [Weissella confusa]WEY49383.1 ATP-binding cassette domain-containing protein [Weissella confusa]
MLSLDKLHVQFGGFVVLDDVSMSFSNSKFYLVMARNGSGKSTLLNAISGLTPYSGKIDHDYQPNEIFILQMTLFLIPTCPAMIICPYISNYGAVTSTLMTLLNY